MKVGGTRRLMLDREAAKPGMPGMHEDAGPFIVGEQDAFYWNSIVDNCDPFQMYSLTRWCG